MISDSNMRFCNPHPRLVRERWNFVLHYVVQIYISKGMLNLRSDVHRESSAALILTLQFHGFHLCLSHLLRGTYLLSEIALFPMSRNGGN